MADSARRPSIISKRTHIRKQQHAATFPKDLPTSPRVIDRLIISLGYAGLASYIFFNPHKVSPRELAALSVSSLTLSWGLYDLGKRNGMIQGASFALRASDAENETGPAGTDHMEEYLRKEFRGKEFEDLKTAEKIAWLRKEEKRIRAGMKDMQMSCGQAYIGKEEAYSAYEKLGAYGGQDWKRYNEADRECQGLYTEYEKAQNRLRRIREEINELNELI